MKQTVVVAVVLTGVALVGLVMLSPRVRRSRSWRATVTPLASIIGSGFLVITPLLASTVGGWAPVAMLAIVGLGWWVGSAIRVSILEVEGLLEAGRDRFLRVANDVGEAMLGLAYVISVAFYLRLMSAFVLGGADGELAPRLVTTAVLAAIGVVGVVRGLHGLETVEETAVGIKLAVIAGLVAGLLALAAADPGSLVHPHTDGSAGAGWWTTARYLGGMLLVVQGFETSRYLGNAYGPALRVRTMRRAQLLSGVIYVAFVTLSVPLFHELPAHIDETAILTVAGAVTSVLVPLLVVAAVASQLSAAVADTAGAGEMLGGEARVLPGPRSGYIAVVVGAIALVWVTDVFAIVSLASRAFAAYYLVQAATAFYVVRRDRQRRHRTAQLCAFGALTVVLAFIVVFAVPAA